MKPFTVNSLAERWGCSTTCVYSLVTSGELPSFRLGGKLIRIRHDDVEAYEQRDVSGKPEDTAASPESIRHIARMIRQGQR